MNDLFDEFLDDAPGPQGVELPPWRVLIVDDDSGVHQATIFALEGTIFDGRGIEFTSAHSAAEAKQLLQDGQRFAMIFLDVVMESDDSGLELARWIREDLSDTLVRIVLRTGQPGQAPERSVIQDFEIDDYKTKTELTRDKLYTALIASLRSYRNISAIARSRDGLRKVIQASANLFLRDSFRAFAQGVLEQVSAVVADSEARFLFVREKGAETPDIIASNATRNGVGAWEEVEASVQDLILEAFEQRSLAERPNGVALFIGNEKGQHYVMHVGMAKPLDDMDRDFLELYSHRISAGFQTAELMESLRRTHAATVEILATVVEYRDDITGGHVARVGDLAERTARALLARRHPDVSDTMVETIRYGAMLHDLGKIAIADAILCKPGALTENERATMQGHAEIGAQMIETAIQRSESSPYLVSALDIARSHHERWDGTGYPLGLAGADIPITARIVAACDVYDALLGKRPYKEPWSREAAATYLRENSGTHFDPEVLDALFEVIDAQG